MDADLGTLALSLYVMTDDYLKAHPELAPWRPKVGLKPTISDAELITLAVMQALLGHTNERRWIRYAHAHLRHLFPTLLNQSGYNKRLRLHLLATLDGLPVGFALTGAKADERDTLHSILTATSSSPTGGQVIMTDKGYAGKDFEMGMGDAGIAVLRPAKKNEEPRAGAQFLKPLRQRIESVFDTLKDQLGLERHGGRTPQGVIITVLQRLLALNAAIWHNHATGQPILRSLTAYDH